MLSRAHNQLSCESDLWDSCEGYNSASNSKGAEAPLPKEKSEEGQQINSIIDKVFCLIDKEFFSTPTCIISCEGKESPCSG